MADDTDQGASIANSGLEAVVVQKLLACLPDESLRVIRVLRAVNPRKPCAQMSPVRVGQTEQFVSVPQVEEFQRHIRIESKWKHPGVVGSTSPASFTADPDDAFAWGDSTAEASGVNSHWR
jgi:hypothetical protein